jgi:hypothetical protein
MKVIRYFKENSSHEDMDQSSPQDWSPCYQHPVYLKFKSHNGRKEYRFKAFLESVKYPEDNSYRTFRRINKALIAQNAIEEVNYENDDDYLPPTPSPTTYTNYYQEEDFIDCNNDDCYPEVEEHAENPNDSIDTDQNYQDDDYDDNDDDDNDDDDDDSDDDDDDDSDDNDDDDLDNDCENHNEDQTDESDEKIESEEFETRYLPKVSNDEECYNFTKDLCDELNNENAYISSIRPA